MLTLRSDHGLLSPYRLWVLVAALSVGGCAWTRAEPELTIQSWGRLDPPTWPTGVPICPSWPLPDTVPAGGEKAFIKNLVTNYHRRYPEWRFEACLTVVRQGAIMTVIPEGGAGAVLDPVTQQYQIPVERKVAKKSFAKVLWVSAVHVPDQAVWKAHILLSQIHIGDVGANSALVRTILEESGVKEGAAVGRAGLQKALEAAADKIRELPGVAGSDWTLERLSSDPSTDCVALWIGLLVRSEN